MHAKAPTSEVTRLCCRVVLVDDLWTRRTRSRVIEKWFIQRLHSLFMSHLEMCHCGCSATVCQQGQQDLYQENPNFKLENPVATFFWLLTSCWHHSFLATPRNVFSNNFVIAFVLLCCKYRVVRVVHEVLKDAPVQIFLYAEFYLNLYSLKWVYLVFLVINFKRIIIS